jgi:hypothetical protein
MTKTRTASKIGPTGQIICTAEGTAATEADEVQSNALVPGARDKTLKPPLYKIRKQGAERSFGIARKERMMPAFMPIRGFVRST